jgi:DNA-binding response OmpR family regulator
MAQQRILIADDESYLTQILTSTLRRRGYDVSAASDGLAAYEAAAANPPDLLICDYQMPGLNGLNLCVRLKATSETSGIPVLMLTARGHILTDDDLARTNIRAVLPKPFSARDLFPKIEDALRPATREQRKAG